MSQSVYSGYDLGYGVDEELAELGDAGQPADPVRQVASRTFYHENGVWIDGQHPEGAETRQIKAFSDEYFALARKDRRAAQFLAQGPRVIFVLGRRVVRSGARRRV